MFDRTQKRDIIRPSMKRLWTKYVSDVARSILFVWPHVRNNSDLSLLIYLLASARVYGKPIELTTTELAAECRMSAGSLHNSRTWLLEKGWIKGEQVRVGKGRPRWRLTPLTVQEIRNLIKEQSQ
jgi:hypothetical protein